MMQYDFDLLGLGVALQVPAPIQISQRLRPFLCATGLKQVDCTIQILHGSVPQPSESGFWYGLECYDQAEDRKQIFHCHKMNDKPFAVTELDKEGNIQITVEPECADHFAGTSGIFNRIGFENLLLQHSGLLLHASLIEYARKGIAFAGPSGVGKSTQADLWCRALGAKILNGDRAALRKTEGGWMAYGSPYAGTSGIYCNESAPLSAIVVLRQGEKNSLQRLSGAKAMGLIWPEISARRWDGAFVAEVTALCAQMLTDIPVYLLECLPDESAAMLLKEGLSL